MMNNLANREDRDTEKQAVKLGFFARILGKSPSVAGRRAVAMKKALFYGPESPVNNLGTSFNIFCWSGLNN